MRAVILAGGSGRRLWPLSTIEHPKQFVAPFGEQSMIQTTIGRLSDLPLDSLVVVCNEKHGSLVVEQLEEIRESGSIILEPLSRNTAPAISLAALYQREDDNLLLVLPSDHVISDQKAFSLAVIEAIPLAEQGKLVTFGVSPTGPHTGYGYIEVGDRIGCGFSVSAFREKPDLKTAKKYLESTKHYWNSGIFLFKAGKYLAELRVYHPEIYDACVNAIRDVRADSDWTRIDHEAFKLCPDLSVDYAVMENTRDAVVVPLHAGWDDIGSWSSIWDISSKDADGNATVGQTIVHNSRNNYIMADDKLVATVGVDDSIVVATSKAVLVAHKDKAQDINTVTRLLELGTIVESENANEARKKGTRNDLAHIRRSPQLKHEFFEPGEKIQISVLDPAGEHWLVVAGRVRITNTENTFLRSRNQHFYFSPKVSHSLEILDSSSVEMIRICLTDF